MIDGERQLITRLLKRRLGSLSTVMIDQIGCLTLSQLETLGDALLDFKDIDDFERWFDQVK